MGVAVNLAKAEGPEYTATKSLMIQKQTRDEFIVCLWSCLHCGALSLHCSLHSEAQDLQRLLQSLTPCGLTGGLTYLSSGLKISYAIIKFSAFMKP